MSYIGKLNKGSLLTSIGPQNIQLASGVDGQVLTADSTSPTGLAYKSISGGDGGNIKVTKFETPGSFTWTKDSNCVSVIAIGVGGGSGGGGGATDVSGGVSVGGSGGVGAGGFYYESLASSLSASESVVVGAGGTGGLGATTIDSDGQNGSPGGFSSFANISTWNESFFQFSIDHTYGQGGTPSSGTSISKMQPIVTNAGVFRPSVSGGIGACQSGINIAGTSGTSYPFVASSVDLISPLCNLGGGGGGGITNSGGVQELSAGAGGEYLDPATGSVLRAGGIAGINPGDNGGVGLDGGEDGGMFFCGTAGGGGASDLLGNGGNGGDGGKFGAGGGGGAGAVNGFTAGNGGNGGDGVVWIIENLKASGSGGTEITVTGPTILTNDVTFVWSNVSTSGDIITLADDVPEGFEVSFMNLSTVVPNIEVSTGDLYFNAGIVASYGLTALGYAVIKRKGLDYYIIDFR